MTVLTLGGSTGGCTKRPAAAAAAWDGCAKLRQFKGVFDPPTPLAPAAAAAPMQTLGRLGVQWDKKTKAMRVPKDLYANLLSVGNISIDMGGGQQQAAAAAAAAANGSDGTVRLGYDAASARDWWKNFVFGKTFVERRSMLTMYRWVAVGWVRLSLWPVGLG